MPDQLGELDELINSLEAAVDHQEEPDFVLRPGSPPRPATVRITAGAYTSSMDRKPRPAQVHEFADGRLLLRTASDVPRGMEIEAEIMAAKDGSGEVVYEVSGSVERTRRVSGAYESQVTVKTTRRVVIPMPKCFLQYAVVSDAVGWNRWCADLREGAQLKGMDLKHMVLPGFDLCCADLSGCNLSESDLTSCNLSGADLSGSLLDGVRIAGADLFRARLPARYSGLVIASGTVEAESVILV